MRTVKFKSSEVGPIPEEWEVKSIANVAPLQRGFDLPSSQLRKGLIPVVYSNGIGAYHNQGKCYAPGLITGRSGTIGRFTYISSGEYWPHNTSLWVTDFYGNCPLFIKYLYETLDFEDFSTGTGVPTLNRNSVHEHKIAVPPRPEQERIAEALSDVDALLSAMTTLIEKKRAIKQGAMHQLLTGKKRLVGFTGKWVETHIGELTDVITGATPSTERPDYWGGDIRWMSSGELNDKIVSEVSGRITKKGFDACSTHMIPVGCVLIGLAGQGKTRGTAAYNLVEMCTNQSIASILPNPYFDSKFLYYYMDRQYDDLRLISAGDGGRGGLTKGQIEKYPVKIPPTISEQKAISEVLSDMDAEIAALAAKRAKYESVKQGMMQELLTGRVRLGVRGGQYEDAYK